MKKILQIIVTAAVLGLSVSPAIASDGIDGAKLFHKKCKMCHAIAKKKMGPAVKTMNSDAEALRSVITNGQKRMPKFGHKFSAEEIDALVLYIQSQH